MRSFFLRPWIALLLLTFCAPAFAQQNSGIPADAESYAGHVPGVVYVQFRVGYLPANIARIPGYKSTSDPVEKIFNEIGASSITPFDAAAWKDSLSHVFGVDRMYVVNYTSNAAPLSVVVRLLQTGLVQTASPRYIFKTQYIPNDNQYVDQYYMQRIQAEGAWDVTRGDSNVIIADVDEGVNYDHEDLKANIKINPGETGLDAQGHPKQSNGLDDDGDGYADDWRGWDAAGDVTNFYLKPDNDPYPSKTARGLANEATHGTMTTGCFGAVADNSVGISGVAPLCKILPVKIGNDNADLSAAYEGIYYASSYLAKHAKRGVINNSWGGRSNVEALPFGQIFQDMITARGQVCVASAGNYSLNNDITPFYPACVPGVLSVGATDQQDKPSSFTHYGKSVLVYAPGVGIRTTEYDGYPAQNNEYTTSPDVDGTSFSGPITAGIVGLVMSKFPNLSPEAVKKRIIDACDPIVGKGNNPLFHGRVNAMNSVTAPATPALAVDSFTVNGSTKGVLGDIGSHNAVDITFVNSSNAGSSLSASIVDGPGYTSDHVTAPIGNIGELETRDWSFTITRTGEFSEGAVPMSIAVWDGGSYHDTLHIQVPVSKIPGMTHRLLVQHGTCVKQIDTKNGWAGFGYHIEYYDPETKSMQHATISQYSHCTDTGWSVSNNFDNNSDPSDTITTVDAIDAQHAWFGGSDINGNGFTLHYTVDGGANWNSSTPDINIRAMHFSDANNGTIIGDAASGKWQVETTKDGGASWTMGGGFTATTPSEQTFYNDAAWVGSDGWFGTNNGEVVTSYNGHGQWKSYALPTTLKNISAIAMAFDAKNGYAAAHGAKGDSLFFTTQNGIGWAPYKKGPAGFNVYAITFIPGTDTAVITSSLGVFLLANANSDLIPLPAPSSWDARGSFLSAGGVSGNYRIAANSDPSGVADFLVGGSSGVASKPEVSSFELVTAPNPFTTSTTLYFTMSKTERVHIYLTDVLGRGVTEVYNGGLSEGPHGITIESGNLANGIYHCAIETESGERAERSIVLSR